VVLHVLVVALGSVGIVSGDVQDIARADGDVLVADRVARADLGTLCVKGNSQGPTRLGGLGLARIVNDGLVVLVAAVRKVHAHDVEPDLAEGVDLLGGVGLGADRADDGGAAVCLWRGILGVQLREPFDPGAPRVEVVERVGHCGSGVCGMCGTGRGGSAPEEVIRTRQLGCCDGRGSGPTSKVLDCWEGSSS
jgi:hypothetical protein